MVADNFELSQLLNPPSGAASRQVDTSALARHVLESFQLIEPWYTARSNFQHHLVITMANKIVAQSHRYFEAITMSLETAQDGYSFAEDAISLCDFLISGCHSVEELTSFINGMKQLAHDAQKRSVATSEQFRDVRKELYEISKRIPSDVVTVQKELGMKEYPRETAGFRFIIISLPLGDIDSIDKRHERQSSQKSDYDVLEQLKKAGKDLDKLANDVGRFVDWWGAVKIQLDSLERVIPQIKPDSSNSLRTKNVRSRWRGIKDQYVNYQRQISKIQDYFPELMPHETGKVDTDSIHHCNLPSQPGSVYVPIVDPKLKKSTVRGSKPLPNMQKHDATKGEMIKYQSSMVESKIPSRPSSPNGSGHGRRRKRSFIRRLWHNLVTE